MASRTPPGQNPLSHNSPVRVKSVHSNADYQNDNLVGGRMAVLEDLGKYIPEVTFDEFMDYLAPPQPEFNVDTTMQLLKSGTEPTLTSLDRWSHFPDEPKKLKGSETTVFNPILNIFMKVVAAIVATSGGRLAEENRTVDFLQNPSLAPISTERRNESRPDGYLVLRDRKIKMSEDGKREDIHWADIAVPCEFKLKDSSDDLDDDVRKMLWSLQHIMRDDVRHRASFGITIESANVRVWFCCRTSVIVSQVFNFITEPKKLIKLFAAFAFANEYSLGFDTTIQPVPGEMGQFFITVHPDNGLQNPRKFQTKKIISSYGAEPLRGRGTRVFEAVELDGSGKPNGPHVVLKDFWIDTNRIREGSILRLLYEEADDDDKQLVEKYFLTTISHGDVLAEHGIDDTANVLMHGLDVDKGRGSQFRLQRRPIMQNPTPASGSEGLRAISRMPAYDSHHRYEHKTHYRVVFKEVGTTIDRMENLSDVMKVLDETADALRLLRKLGWMHRDVSIGNILSYDGHAKLADLEYAKRTSDLTCHEMRTGTLNFMSIEVAAQKFLFLPLLRAPSDTELDEATGPQRRREETVQTEVVPFSPNHLHDLESLWWVAVWVVFYNFFGTSPSATRPEAMEQLRLAQTLFPPVLDSSLRRDGFRDTETFENTCAKLPSNKEAAGKSLNYLRKLLISHYQDVEKGHPKFIDLGASKNKIYYSFRKAFSRLEAHSKGLNLYSISKPYEERSKEGSSKRPRSESTNDPGDSQKTQRI